MIIDKYRILREDEVRALLIDIEDHEEWKPGLAKTPDATAKTKHNLELKQQDGDTPKRWLTEIRNRLGRNKELVAHGIVDKIMTPKFNKSTDGGGYDRHGDSAIMSQGVRTDLACTLFLSNPSSYEGGTLCIEDAAGNVTRVKEEPGIAVVYECHNPHWVERVTSGSRVCAITWIQSKIREQEKRNLLRRFSGALNKIEADPDLAWSDLHTTLGSVQGKLIRMWVE